jgi:hypothetical protein
MENGAGLTAPITLPFDPDAGLGEIYPGIGDQTIYYYLVGQLALEKSPGKKFSSLCF